MNASESRLIQRAPMAYAVLMLVILLLPAIAKADFTFTILGGNATVTGYSGTPPAALNIPSTYFNGTSNYPVTSVASLAFTGSSVLTSVTVPSSVTSIGSLAFGRCTKLTSISVDNFNPTYSSIGGVLFDKNKTTLIQYPAGVSGSYSIPSSVVTLASAAFYYCDKMTSITFASSVTSIEFDAFFYCKGLTSITIPSNIASIGAYAFEYCSNIATVTISDGVTNIGTYAFQYCSGLVSVQIPASVTTIGQGAFGGCTKLISINVDALNSTYSSANGILFNEDKTTLIQYPAGVPGVYSVPSTVSSIVSAAFDGSSGLTSITIPAGVTAIGQKAFRKCVKLSSLAVDPLNSNYSSVGAVLFDKGQTTLIQFPGTAGHYSIPQGVTTIGPAAFEGSSLLTSVTISTGISSIGSSSFANCSGLTSVTIPSSVTNIGAYAFIYCYPLQRAIFQGNAPMMGIRVFDSAASGFKIYFMAGTAGFTVPSWNNYPTSLVSLSGLAMSSGILSPVFNAHTMSYSASVANATASLRVTSTISNSAYTIKVNGSTVPTGISSGPITLSVGANNISISVIGPDSISYVRYILTVTRSGSQVSTLSSIAMSSGILSPVFSSGTYAYTSNISSDSITSTVTPVASDPSATVKVNGNPIISGGSTDVMGIVAGSINSILIEVTAQDGISKSTYTIYIDNTPYGKWRKSVFSSSAAWTNLLVSGDMAAPVHDGITNLMKYAMALPPMASCAADMPTSSIQSGYLTLKYRRSKIATDITYSVQANDLPGANNWGPANLVISQSDQGEYWLVTVRDSVPAAEYPHRFMRLSVNKQPP